MKSGSLFCMTLVGVLTCGHAQSAERIKLHIDGNILTDSATETTENQLSSHRLARDLIARRGRDRRHEDLDIVVYFGSESSTCWSSLDHVDELCEASIDSQAQSVRIEVSKRGFKKYTHNVPNIKTSETGNGHIRYNLGDVRLVSSELPKVEQILHAISREGEHLFEVTLRNDSEREFLITSMELGAFKEGANIACCCPPSAIFKFDDDLEVATQGGDSLGLIGGFEEVTRSAGYTARASGELFVNGCTGAERLNLRMPTSILLPAEKYIAVQAVIPPHFRITNSEWTFILNEDQGPPDPKWVENQSFLRFDEYVFAFETGHKDELPIVAVYPR